MKTEKIIEKLNKIANSLDEKKLYKEANKIDKISNNVFDIKLAQYVGVQGYAIRNSRCMDNCKRIKKSKNKNLTSQQVWEECWKEYKDSINNDNSKWDKYADNKVANMKIASQKDVKNLNIKTAQQLTKKADELLNIAHSLKDPKLSNEITHVAEELLKEAQFFSNLYKGVKNIWNKGDEILKLRKINNRIKQLLQFITQLKLNYQNIQNNQRNTQQSQQNTQQGQQNTQPSMANSVKNIKISQVNQQMFSAFNDHLNLIQTELGQISQSKNPHISQLASSVLQAVQKWQNSIGNNLLNINEQSLNYLVQLLTSAQANIEPVVQQAEQQAETQTEKGKEQSDQDNPQQADTPNEQDVSMSINNLASYFDQYLQSDDVDPQELETWAKLLHGYANKLRGKLKNIQNQ